MTHNKDRHACLSKNRAESPDLLRISSESRSDIFALCQTVVLGASREETATVPERVCALGAELGVENVVCILDQNLNYIDGDVYERAA